MGSSCLSAKHRSDTNISACFLETNPDQCLYLNPQAMGWTVAGKLVGLEELWDTLPTRRSVCQGLVARFYHKWKLLT